MAKTFEELSVKFTADIADMNKKLDTIESKLVKTGAVVVKQSAKMSKAFSSFSGLLSAGVMVAGISKLVQLSSEMDNLGDSLVAMEGRANIGIESLQRLRLVAAQNGSSAESLDTALVKLNKSIGEARGGSEEMRKVFATLGLAQLINEGASTEQVFYGVADALKQITDKFKDPQLANAVTLKLMGKSADDLGGFMNKGALAVKQFAAAVPDAAIVTGGMAHKLDDMADRTALAEMKLKKMGAYLEVGFIEALDAAAAGLQEFWNMDLGGDFKPDFDSVLKKGLANEAAASRSKHGAHNIDLGGGNANLGDVSKVFGGGDGASGGGSSDAANKIKQHREALEELISQMEFELSLIGMTEKQQEVATALRKAGTVATDKERLAITNLAEKTVDARIAQEKQLEIEQFALSVRQQYGDGTEHAAEMQERLNEALRQGLINKKQFDKALESASESDKVKELKASWKAIGDEIENDFANAFVDMASGAKSANEAIGELLQSMGQLIAKQLILQAVQGITGSIFGDGGLGGALAKGIVGGSAMGGAGNPGNAYLVGEAGPEIFMPRIPGSIIPNRSLGGGASVVVNAPLNVGSGVNRAELSAALTEHKRQIHRSIVPIVADANRRNKIQLH